MIPTAFVALKFIENHQGILISTNNPREYYISSWRKVFTNRFRWIDSKDIELDFKSWQVMFQDRF